jgi:hypothetical protein
MTLGYSHKSVGLLTFRSSTRIWTELHELPKRASQGDSLAPKISTPDSYKAVLFASRVTESANHSASIVDPQRDR